MQPPSILKKILSTIAVTVTVAAICTSACACQNADDTPPVAATSAETTSPATETDGFLSPEPPPQPTVLSYPAIRGDGRRFADDSQKERWEQPLAKLLSNVLIPYGEGGEILGYRASTDENAPAVAMGHCCGLLDVTADGTPELLVFPMGYGGSSGNAFYLAYDILTGEEIGHLDGGHDEAWCFYYDTEADECRLYGQFMWRIGWSGRERFIQKVVCLDDPLPYQSASYLMTSHSIDVVAQTTADGDEVLEEVYNHTDYYINDERVSLDRYYSEYDRFVSTCIRLPETALVLCRWDDVAEEEDGYPEKGAKMAYALTHSEQAFPMP